MRARSILVALGLFAVFVLAIAWGMGGQKTAQGAGSSLFGDGSDGPMTFSSNTTLNPPADAVVDSGSAGGTALTLSGVSGVFQPGQRILIHQTRGTGAGNWELNSVQSYALGNMVTMTPLAYTYATSGADRAQVLVMPQYTNVTVNAVVTVSAKPWNGTTGGILAFLASGKLTIDGTISTNGGGYRGGFGDTGVDGFQGEGTAGAGSQGIIAPNGNGGGGSFNTTPLAGGGGGNGSAGGNSTDSPPTQSPGGNPAGTVDLIVAVFGGGGGGSRVIGGDGGGIAFLFANSLNMGPSGKITAGGQDGNNGDSGSGGGAGGSILLKMSTGSLGSGTILAPGGAGGLDTGGQGSTNENGGYGGVGRIRAEWCTSITGGVASPPASIAQISCGPKPTPTITPTPTKQPFPADTDGDGCPDVRENQPKSEVANGGGRDYLNPWDWYDVNKDGVIDLINDILGVIDHWQPNVGGAAPYDIAFDRGPAAGAHTWDMTAPDGVIDLINDILGVIDQFSPTGCT